MKVMILRGLPGSGKTTFANQQQMAVCSADTFPGLYRPDGSMDFSLLGAAHAACTKKFIRCCGDNIDVVVDNTNTTSVELSPYVAIARAYGIEPETIQFSVEIEELFNPDGSTSRRNTHDVPRHVIERMAKQLTEPLPPFFPAVKKV